MAAELNDKEMLRCSRQVILCGFDFDGQERLKIARMLVTDLGGPGYTAIQYLAAAGADQLTLSDFDAVSLLSPQHQILRSDATTGQPKVGSIHRALARVDSYVRLVLLNALLDETALTRQITGHDLVLDYADNVATRNQFNVGCSQHTTPLISGVAIRMEGQINVFTHQDGEPCCYCLSCLSDESALACVEAGVMAPLMGTIDPLQVMGAIKLLTDYSTPASGKIVICDAMTCQFHEVKLIRYPQCEVYGSH